VTLAEPLAVLPTKLTEQLPADTVHVVALNEPPIVVDSVKVTVPPVGVIAVPAVEVSVTVAVQVEDWSTTTAAHETVVAEVRGLTVIEKGALVLPAWPGEGVVSPPYVPVTVAVPLAVLPRKVTEQLAPVGVIAVKPQLVALNEPPVAPAENVKVTVPVGVLVGVVVSATVAVHVEVWSTIIGLAQETVVVVISRPMLTVMLAARLAGLAL
jgi:hypothetical protein